MSKVKKVFKYATGQTIPFGAVYLSTQVETLTVKDEDFGGAVTSNMAVWHYFLVEVEGESN